MSTFRFSLLWSVLYFLACWSPVLCADSGLPGTSHSMPSNVVDPQPVDRPPNILIVLADDLGFSDLGCYGGEIETPVLDGLARQGLRYTQFHNTGRCWPTRSSLLSGYYAQQIRRDRLAGIHPSGGRGKRPAWAPLLPEYLKPKGYRSYHSGKWHVDRKPIQNGFDASYWLNDHGRFFSPRRTFENDNRLPPVKEGTDYYATTEVASRAIAQLKQHHQEHQEDPFLQFVAFTAPHFPLHALPEDIAKYQGKYDSGWKQTREKRWRRIQELGIVNGQLSQVDREQGPPYPLQKSFGQFGPDEIHLPLVWDSLSESQKKFQADKMEIHAAMVDRMDQEIGRICQQLKSMQAYENTLILFLSDNGASAEIMIRDDGHDPKASPGSAKTHLCLGPGWSTVCNTPFRKHKTWVHEGGTATPLIVHWPASIKKGGELRHSVGHVIDILPTLMEAAGLPLESTQDGQPQHPGLSLIPTFAKKQLDERTLWWSHENHKAIRVGDWKLVKTNKTDWELFNLAEDRAETRNQVASHPRRVKEMQKKWNAIQQGFVEKLTPASQK